LTVERSFCFLRGCWLAKKRVPAPLPFQQIDIDKVSEATEHVLEGVERRGAGRANQKQSLPHTGFHGDQWLGGGQGDGAIGRVVTRDRQGLRGLVAS